MYNFIKNDFKDYLKKENLIAASTAHFSNYLQNFLSKLRYITISESPNWVLDKESGMIYNHDFPNNTLATINQYHEFQHAKYDRRIKRLYNAMTSGKHVYFIRYLDITKIEACEIYQLIKHKFPTTAFTLIVIGNAPAEFGQDWGLSHIKNLLLDQDSDDFWQKLCANIVNGTLR